MVTRASNLKGMASLLALPSVAKIHEFVESIEAGMGFRSSEANGQLSRSVRGGEPGAGRNGAPALSRPGLRAGWKVLLPGYAQWTWRQRGRAGVLFGTYAVSLVVGLFGWGTGPGLALLLLAFATHVTATADVVWQSAFPGFGCWTPLASAGGSLGIAVYGPALAIATLVAWPALEAGTASEGYLVDCRAYRSQPPRNGDWVWLESSPWGETEPRLGQVIAAAGQGVEWRTDQVRVDGRPVVLPTATSGVVSGFPGRVDFLVPPGHVLIARSTRPAQSFSPPITLISQTSRGSMVPPLSDNLMLVPVSQVIGRAWAQLYPIHAAQLLR